MLETLKRLFGKRNAQWQIARTYSFLEVDASELGKATTAIPEIRAGNKGIDGVIVRNALTPEEVASVLTDLNRQMEMEVQIDEGLNTYPMAFSQIDQASLQDEVQLSDVFNQIELNWKEISQSFEVPLWQKVVDGLSLISGHLKVEVPRGLAGKGTYNPATFRRLQPKTGTLVPHCGRYFQKEFPFLFTHLANDSVLEDQMSFFFTLQEADEDGELVLYDALWSEAESRPDHDTLVYKNGKVKKFTNSDDFTIQLFKPKAGDLLCFAGGRIWHKVSHVQGQTERITFGGFLTPSKDGKRLYAWS